MSEPATSSTPATASPRSRAATRQAWVQRLQRFATSGLGPAQFCAQEGVSLPSFYSWKRRLAAAADTASPSTLSSPPPLLPIPLPPRLPALELTLPTGVIVRLPPEADEATLRALFRLLGVSSC